MLIKRFFNNNATGQPKEEGSNAPLNPVLSCIIKTVGFRRIPCQRSLATSVDVDRTILRNSRPMLFSESGRRHDRVWVEKRSHLGQCSLTNIEFGLLELLHRVSPGVAMLLARCGGFI